MNRIGVNFGAKARQSMGNCAAIGTRFDRPLSPAILFYSTLETVDTEHRILAGPLRDAALRVTVGFLKDSHDTGLEAMREIIEQLTDDASTGALARIRAIDLITLAAASQAAEIEAGLATVGTSLDVLMDRIRHAEEFATDDPIG